MSDQLRVGIDYGDLGFRVAYVEGGQVRILPLPVEITRTSIFFDPHSNISNIGVGFPSITRNLGTGIPFGLGERTETPEYFVQQGLSAIRQTLAGFSGKPMGPTVLAVPAALSQSKRQVLVGRAQEAGFPAVSLIDRCTAVALGHQGGRDESGTLVVYQLGYSDCEYALIRLARGRCRILGSGITHRVSGEFLDAVMIEAIVLALREKRIVLGLKKFTAEQWLVLRQISESARITLSRDRTTEMVLQSQLTGAKQTIRLEVDGVGFAVRAASIIGKTIEDLHALLEQNGLEPGNIDTFLLSGGVANSSPVTNILTHSLGDKPEPTGQNIVAVGAALQACQIGNDPSPPVVPEEITDTKQNGRRTTPLPELDAALDHLERETTSEENRPFVKVIDTETRPDPEPEIPTGPAGEPSEPTRFTQVRELIEQGRYREAGILLDNIAQEVDDLRGEIRRQTPEKVPLTGSQKLIERADLMLTAGRFAEAVSLTHHAYQGAPTDPIVFSGMMRVHAEAGLAMDKPEQYEQALSVLECALRHDQTDRSIHHALAQRHYMHAMAMNKLNNPQKTLEAVKQALIFAPKHEAANKLLRQLTAS